MSLTVWKSDVFISQVMNNNIKTRAFLVKYETCRLGGDMNNISHMGGCIEERVSKNVVLFSKRKIYVTR